MIPRVRRLARLFVPFVLVTAAQPGVAAPAVTAGPPLYSVMTLGGDEYWGAWLNDSGQVAAYGAERNRFFDGARWHDIGSLGGGYTLVNGLNNRGVVIGESLDASEPFGDILGFSWTVKGGMRALPGTSVASAQAINDSNQIVGLTGVPGVSDQAVRWDPNGRTVNLGPLPFSLSEAHAINNRGESGGFADMADGSIHATKWSPSGSVIDLGTLAPNGFAFTEFVNERGEAAGESDNQVFFWSQRDGMIGTGGRATEGAGHVVGLSEGGEVVGNLDAPSGRVAFVWSRARGLVPLPYGSASHADVLGMNKRGDLVGDVERSAGDYRGVRWHGLSAPVDLNAYLHRPPPGLVVQGGLQINDRGDIVAYSNAGLVLLRPGTRGTDAPVLGPVAGLTNIVHLGDDLEFTLSFIDQSPTQTHTVDIRWVDGCTESSPHPLLRDANGVGEVKFRHRFCSVGTAGVWIRVTDSAGNTTEALRQTYVADPASLTLVGQGTLAAPRASGAGKLPVHFSVGIPVEGGQSAASNAAKPGAPFLRLAGPFRFESEQIGTRTRAGQLVRVEGTGRLNGRPGYRFLLESQDTRMHVRVLHTDGSGNEKIDYDNGATVAGGAGMASMASTAGGGSLAKIADGWVKLSR